MALKDLTFQNISKSLKARWEISKEQARLKLQAEKELKDAEEKARRETLLKESVKLAKAKGVQDARKRYEKKSASPNMFNKDSGFDIPSSFANKPQIINPSTDVFSATNQIEKNIMNENEIKKGRRK